jgi:UDP-2,4-diacetamido-2,4,6-trideoxy-beta-L-altropyranose hydrolase/UDP-4-amino-4,6-dideoxy-N-acetyl-beta-L-altrosamine N-acetyltransferase
MRVVFRVDASLEIGTGHVMRCLSLAQVLKETGLNVEFICRRHKGNLINMIRSKGFNVHELELFEKYKVDIKLAESYLLGATQQKDSYECINILKLHKTNWLFVDHYALDREWHSNLKPFSEKLIVIDDLSNRKYQCDILLDQTFGRTKEDYLRLTPKGCKLLIGSKYALLRPEFARWRSHSLEFRKKPKLRQILINMGGIDADNITGKIIKELDICQLPKNVNIVIIMGKFAPHLGSVQILADTSPYKTDVLVDVNNMAEIMANSDLAIGAAGSTSWERCCLGLPTIQFAIAKNQIFLAKKLADHNAVKSVKKVSEIKHLLEDSDEWIKETGIIASKISYGMGTYKVFNSMTDYKMVFDDFGEIKLFNYINLDINDKSIALNMRNHIKIRKWMYNQDIISKREHIRFIATLENEIYRRYFLVKKKNNIIGSINFSEINQNCSVNFGIYANPSVHFKGAGKLLEKVASFYAFNELNVNKIKLDVFSDNNRAIEFYNKCGFKFVDTKIVCKRNITCMEKMRVV